MSKDASPHISVNAQYIKDLSFENPKAPMSLIDAKSGPQVQISLDVNVSKVDEENSYEVELMINVKTSSEEKHLFTIELSYAGIFSLENFDLEQHKQVLGIHCPNLLFPFARRIIAGITQDSGFQPLMIDPIDFASLYFKRASQEQEQSVN